MAIVHNQRESIKKKYQKINLLTKIFLVIGGLFLAGFIFLLTTFSWFAKDLPSPGKLSQTEKSTIFYDRSGKILFELYKEKNRIPVTYDEISPLLINATVAIEDKNFFKHKGISQTGLIRAIISTLLRGDMQGGSTITQQLIKNVLLTQERTLSRKIKEIILAFEVERRYSKKQILEMYLNEAPYGGAFSGIGSAAKGYFNKSPRQLTLVEAAFLAGLPQRPSVYSPFVGTKDAWKGRTVAVLRRMREDGYINKDEEKVALAQINQLKFETKRLSINAPHFVFYVKDYIEKQFGSGIFSQGLKIKTTLDLEVQQKLEKIVKDEIEKIKSLNATNGAVVLLDSQTGEILAMVGSYDYNDKKYGNFNAALGLRQPGSTLKPITYALAFEKGYTPVTVMMDAKTVFPQQGGSDYIPVNYDGKFRGPVQVRFALGNSLNIPAVKMLAMVGVKDFLQKAYEMGIETFEPNQKNLNRFGLSITLGGGETNLLQLTTAFSAFARGGVRKDPQSIFEIKNYNNKTIFKAKKPFEKKVFSQEVSFLISHILSDNNARSETFGTNSYLNIPGKTVAVKTGTSDDKRDNWTVGYTKSITLGVWVGNNDNSPMSPRIASGVTGASPIFYRSMIELLKKYKKDGVIDKPKRVEALIIDAYLGGLPKDGYPTRSEYFVEGTEPKTIAPFYKKLKISKADKNKLANDVEIRTGNFEEKEFIVLTEDDPVSTDGRNRWQEGIDEWIKNQSDEKYKPPKEASSTNAEEVIVSIKSPSDKANLTDKNIQVRAKITSLYSLKKVEIYLNDQKMKDFMEDKKEIDENFVVDDNKTYSLKIRAVNEKDKTGESTVRFGVNKPWDYQEPTSTPIPSPTATPAITITPTPTSP
jgi:1A family penicillin-binding protein